MCGREIEYVCLCGIMMFAKRQMKLDHAVWERTGSSDRRGERGEGRGVTLEVRRRGIEDGRVTEPRGKHAQQNSKNNGQNETNDQQRMKDNEQIREGASVITFPETEARQNLIDRTRWEYHTRDRIAEPKTVGDVRHTRNRVCKHIARRPQEVQHWRKAQVEPQHLDTGDRDQQREGSGQQPGDRKEGTLCRHQIQAR